MYKSCKDTYKKPIVIGGPDYEVGLLLFTMLLNMFTGILLY